jgi:exopolysaccharide biosynthesis operon protein EpsL
MDLMRLIALCALIAAWQQGLAQQLEEYTPLENEKWIQEEQPLKLKLYGGVSYDSNLFRLSDETNPQTVIGTSDKSDIIYRLGGGGKYELRHSRQKFIAEASVTEYKFRNFDNLDNTSNDLRGTWQWEAGHNWDGNLGVGHRRYLEGFGNFQQNVRDMVSQNQVFGSANYLIHSHLKLTLDADWYDTRHSEETRNVLDSKINNTAFTVNWVTPAQNTVGLQYRTADARYPHRETVATTLIENDYSENEYSLVAHWKLGGVSEAFARIGHTEREFDQAPDRNFSAPTWRFTYLWQPTGKTALQLATWRELAEFEDLTANYVRVTGFSVVPTWSITPKVALRGRISLQTLNYLGDPGILPIINRREDKDRLYQISALWTPLRLTELAFTVETGRRTSNQLFADYKYNATSLLLTRYF